MLMVDSSIKNTIGMDCHNHFLMKQRQIMLDVAHSFYGVHFGGEIDFNDAFFKNVNMRFRRFGDDQSSGENRFVFNTEFDIPIQGETINTEFTLDYIGGSFDRNFYFDQELKYGNINVGH